MIRIGFDIGGTKTEIVLVKACVDGGGRDRASVVTVNSGGNGQDGASTQVIARSNMQSTTTAANPLQQTPYQILFKKRLPTERDRGYEHLLCILKKLFDDALLANQVSASDIASIGLALPGSVDPDSQKMLLGNTRILEGHDICCDLQTILNLPKDIPIKAENDANCFALAEALLGAGCGCKNIVGIILGTGVGGGIIVHNQILKGRRGCAGEIGHNFLKELVPVKFGLGLGAGLGSDVYSGSALDSSTRSSSSLCANRDGGMTTCYCGQKNCAELFLSGPGFEQFYFLQTGNKKNLREIFLEPEFLEIYKKDLALFLARLTNILDPDTFVLGGGVSLEDKLYPGIQDLMTPHLFYKNNPPPVFKHAISDSAGGIGAALL